MPIGIRLSGDAASEIGCNGLASGCSQITTYRAQRMHTRIPRIASRHAPEAGAACDSSARTDLGAAGNCHSYRDRSGSIDGRPIGL